MKEPLVVCISDITASLVVWKYKAIPYSKNFISKKVQRIGTQNRFGGLSLYTEENQVQVEKLVNKASVN